MISSLPRPPASISQSLKRKLTRRKPWAQYSTSTVYHNTQPPHQPSPERRLRDWLREEEEKQHVTQPPVRRVAVKDRDRLAALPVQTTIQLPSRLAESLRIYNAPDYLDPSSPAQSASSAPPPPTTHSVLILTGAPPSLAYSDFTRIAHEGLHVDGWVNGLSHVHRAIDLRTGEPRGQYFLFFDNHQTASEYATELKQRHYNSPHSSPQSDDPESHRTFTLLPPGATLAFQTLPLSKVISLAEQQKRSQSQYTAKGKVKDESPLRQQHNIPDTLYHYLTTLSPSSSSLSKPKPTHPLFTHSHHLLLRLHGGRLSTELLAKGLKQFLSGWEIFDKEELKRAIWAVKNYTSVVEIGEEVDGEEGHDGGDEMEKGEMKKEKVMVATRFMMGFGTQAGMDRFVRLVHKREVDVMWTTGKRVMVSCTRLSV